MLTRIPAVILTALLLRAIAVAADTAPAPSSNAGDTTQTLTSPAAAASEAAAVAFLRRVETRNAATRALEARFDQVRIDSVDGSEVVAKGRFYYSAPNQFRADYEAENPNTIWMDGRKLYNFSSRLKQVQVFPQGQGDEAPINQMLLGFGIKVEKIQKIFNLEAGATQAEMTDVVFNSRDLSRSLQYSRITISFDNATAEPRAIRLEDTQGSTITVTLRDVKQNPKIDASIFKPKWPDSTEVVEE